MQNCEKSSPFGKGFEKELDQFTSLKSPFIHLNWFTFCNRFPVVVPADVQLGPPADGDDDGHVADHHHKDG